MRHVNKYHLLPLFAGLLWTSASVAQDQRYLAIQHTDTVYANQGVCAYHFSLE